MNSVRQSARQVGTGRSLLAIALVLSSTLLTETAAAEQSAEASCDRHFREAKKLFDWAHDRDSAGDAQAGQHYERVAEVGMKAIERCPEHREADKALYNTAIALEKAERLESAQSIWLRIVEDHFESQFNERARFRVASISHRFFEIEEAANHFRILADNAQNHDIRRESILKAATIYTDLQEYEKAARYWQSFTLVAPDRWSKVEAEFRACELNHKSGNWARAVGWLQAFLKRPTGVPGTGEFRVRAASLMADAHEKLGNHTEQREALKAVIREFKISGEQAGSRSATLAAEAQFKLADREMAKLQQLECVGEAKTIKSRIKEGTRQVSDLERAYKAVAAYRSPEWTVASLSRTGEAFEIFAACLLASGSAAESEQRRASGMTDRANALYELALSAAKQSGIVSPYTDHVETALARLRPEKYRRSRRGKVRLHIGGLGPGKLALWPSAGEER